MSAKPARKALAKLMKKGSPDSPLLSHPTTGVTGCCATTDNGQAAALPSNVMKSRRRIASPKKAHTPDFDYSRDLRPAEWGSGVSLQCSDPEQATFALGHKQTFAV